MRVSILTEITGPRSVCTLTRMFCMEFLHVRIVLSCVPFELDAYIILQCMASNNESLSSLSAEPCGHRRLNNVSTCYNSEVMGYIT